MAKQPKYTDDEIKKIGELIKEGFTNTEIAKKLGRTRDGIAIISQRRFGGNPNYRKKITKHKHLHEEALKYFLNHSHKETAKHFKLTAGELKSCLTYAYRDPKLKHIRKEKRRHDKWSLEELLHVLKFAGIKSRDEINSEIKRGESGRVIKEKLNELGLSSKNLNGLTVTQFRSVFRCDPDYYIQTSAGPYSMYHATHFKIVPWCYIDELIKTKKIDHEEVFKKYIEAMAMFQRWIHGKDYWKSLCG